jgi:Flp pilus assembly protein TadD
MSRFWGVLLCILSLAASVTAQQMPSPSTAAQSTSAPSLQKEAPPDYSQESFVVEQYTTVARYENDGTGEQDFSERIRVQSDAGVQALGELVFGYNSADEQLDVRLVRVRKSDGSLVNAGPDAVKELTASVTRDAPVYTDYKEKHITVPSLRPGDILEFEIVKRLLTPLAPGEFWFEHNFLDDVIVLDERLEISVPHGRSINLKSPQFSPDETEEQGRTIYRWKHSNLVRPSDEDQAKKTKESSEPKSPDVQLTTFASWEDVARWYAKLERDRVQPDDRIRAKTEELIKGRERELAKIQALYDYVSKNIRYVSLSFGLGRYQPHLAAEVLANQYGDCKDKHTLLAAMLDAAGIKADAVLIPSSRKLDVSLPSPSQFDHVITAIPLGDDLIWMDTTAEVAPFRLLTPQLRKKSALLVPPDGVGKIVETPADPPFLQVLHVTIEGRVSDLGKLTAKLHYTLRGDSEVVFRSAFRRASQKQWKEIGQAILNLDNLQGEVSSIKPSDPSDLEDPFKIELELSEPNFLDWSRKKAKVELPLPAIALTSVEEDTSDSIDLGSPLDVALSLTLSLPASLTAQAPVGVTVTRDYAEFASAYLFEGYTLKASRSLRFKMRELPASRASDYLAFVRAVQADEGQSLAFENSTPGTPAIPATAKASELLEAGEAALSSGSPQAAIPLLQRVVELEPKHKQAWNDLGLSFLRVGKFDDAISAFRKQVEVNPYDERAYDFLGATFQQQQKYTEAADAFRKQIDVNPLDPYAHAGLGSLFLLEHKYHDAIPELEKATILSPDNAELQVGLGQAYLNTDQKGKALAAFEKGVELSESPLVWNNVAYSLADAEIDLDKAQEYAESAVTTTAANLRNIELAHLALDDLRTVESIGSYWDTLGWIYFRKGDLDKAERYIRAAWLLLQHGEVGDHLAQIYVKRAQKDRAIHMYALALAAPRSVPETRARLTILLGGNEQIARLVDEAKPELVELRTIPAGKLLDEKAGADFLILLSPGGKEARVDAVQFVKGSEKLRPFAERLRSLDYGPMFPDESPARLVRRATLTCAQGTDECVLLLLLPEDVRTLD